MLDPDAKRYLEHRRRESALGEAQSFDPVVLRAEERRLRHRYGHGPQMYLEEEVLSAAGVPRHLVLDPCVQPLGTLIYFHGGGWVMGEPEDYVAVCRAIASETSWRVVVSDYRKAPEDPFPAAFDDARALVTWFADHPPHTLTHERLRLGVIGDSAGGNLAAAVAAHFAALGSEALAVQVLITPVLDTDLETPSYRDPSRQLTLTREAMVWFMDQYVDAGLRRDFRVAPLHAREIAGLPPTVFVSVHSDVLHSEGQAYLDRLRAAGVPLRHLELSGQMHGFFQLYNVMGASQQAVTWISQSLRDLNDLESGARHQKGTA
ncbi:alpha/beta hydrolase [Brevibacterium aurantiacum]|uniref:alpha/beta hydrolase n=1 Tax=Brevibacterium aurantiacum TaxID=273384 RepID=UPI0018682882|nr:alpha/beta hydrolase [Brevibacterium aurantiacum]